MNGILKTIIEKCNSKNTAYQPVDLNQLKLRVIHNNENDINRINDELEKLKKDLDLFPRLYCNKYGHSYYVTDYYRKGETGWHSFAGDEVVYYISYCCAVCGAYDSYEGAMYGVPNRQYKKHGFPEDAYDDLNVQKDGRTYRMVQEEISRLENYLAYCQYLKNKICELAGHTVEKDGECKCICCGKTMSYYEYNKCLNANSKTVTNDYFSSLPSFEEYQDQIKQERESNPNNESSGAKTKRIIYN